MKTISINGKEFTLKYSLRAFFIFENLSGYPFQFGKMIDEFLLFYSLLLANNESFTMEFDEFIDSCENDLTLFNQFKALLLDEIKLRSQSAGNGVKKKEGDDAEEKAVSIRELYSRVVGEGGIAPDYFLDKMDFIEAESFLDGLNRRNRESWEQTRLLGYIIAQSNSTKTLKQTDILRFPWDEEEKKDTSVTNEDMKRLRAKAKALESQLNTNKDV